MYISLYIQNHCSLQSILQVVDKIPTIATQLKIITAVKATRQGGDGESVIAHVHIYMPVWL